MNWGTSVLVLCMVLGFSEPVTEIDRRIAVADAIVSARKARLPELPDSMKPRIGAAPVEVAELPPAKTATPPSRTVGPEIEVRIRVSHQCPDCDRVMREMKLGGGQRQIRWVYRDYGEPVSGLPYIEWTASGRNWFVRGFVSRTDLESMIRQTEQSR